MLKHPAKALEDSAKQYLQAVKNANRENRRRNFNKKPKNYIRELSNIASGLWLEYAFGWVPLLHDIQDARDAYNSLLDKDRIAHVSSGGKDARGSPGPITVTSPGYGLSMKVLWTNHRVDIHKVRYRGAVKAQAVTTASDRLARFGFTPSEFLPTAWELLPWSFLADYFANIGDLINASMTDTSNVAWVNVTDIKEAHKDVYVRLDMETLLSTFSGWTILSTESSPSHLKWIRRSVSRSGSGIPFPSLYFTYPKSDTRLLNVAALLQQVGFGINPQRKSGRTYRL
jgi:hypothetical protein